MKALRLFRTSVLALAIAGASGTGYGTLMTGVETYQKAADFTQTIWAKSPIAKSPDPGQQDQPLTQNEYIFAWVLGRDCYLNHFGGVQKDPAKKLQSAIEAWSRVPSYDDDEVVISLIIKVPDNPWDLAGTLDALHKHSFMYITDAHTGFMEASHRRFGLNRG